MNGNIHPGQRLRHHLPQRVKSTNDQDLGPITISTVHLAHPLPTALTIDPSDAGAAATMARQLAQQWAANHNNGRHHTANAERLALVSFFELLNQAYATSWGDVNIDLLRRSEEAFAGLESRAMALWRLLRDLPAETLSPDVEMFVKSPPNVRKAHTQPVEAMPQSMLRDVLRQAMRDVTSAEERIMRADWDGQSPPPVDALIERHEATAFYILLCMEWSMSPDVVASLSFDSSQPTSVSDWNEGKPKVTVKWFKNRGGAKDVALMLADKPWRAGSLLRRLRDTTAATRHLGGPGWADYPWLCAEVVDKNRYQQVSRQEDVRSWNGTSGIYISSIHRSGSGRGLRAWCEHSRSGGKTVLIDSVYDGQRLGYQAIRPAAKWARFEATGGSLLLRELVDDNTIETLSTYYLNSEVAMRDIAEAWSQVPSMAEEIARGLRPTAVDHEGRPLSGAHISSEEVTAALGENRVGVSGCRDPMTSPLTGEKPGRLCSQANRSCYFCPNSVVSPDDVPALIAYLQLADKAKANLSPPEWELHWGITVRWVRYVLPLLDASWESLPVEECEPYKALFDLGMEAGPA